MQRTGYRLNKPSLAIGTRDGQRLTVVIPANATVYVLKRHGRDRFVDVDWDGQTVEMFAVDLTERGEPFSATGSV